MESSLKRELEAILILENGLVPEGRLLKLLVSFSPALKQLRDAVAALNEEYLRAGFSFYIERVETSYQLSVRPKLKLSILEKYRTKRKKLPTGVLETLAIIAYKQPTTRIEIESLRGVNCSHPLKLLLQEELIVVTGRKKAPGAPVLFSTSIKFLQKFGFESLKALPKLEEIKSYAFLEESEKTS